ncbi:4,5-dihydroxyphthalate decarboxylase [Roseivivax jejudonensis]|uniref:4,5-dihydroxyphthalate decarboxylase n=1 Tax=Roseivivax jejudonensis TaxID=1529041 RepID=A0A1X6ZXN1_9RHOB|nr:4,5-dihydroxyphthalate decarboxylase [Roseivivax jejudonensis]SLN64246.1 4,5-dihydroxyphthalate decarboxylase [Roseivivax jejudonensis]
MPKTRLSAVSRTQGNNRALKEGAVGLPDFELDFEEVNPLPRAFRRMVREGAYDVSEMALTTFLCARAHGAPLTGLPIFLVRDFHHKSMAMNAAACLSGPKDLEGRRVGVMRGYTVTTGVWARTILAEEHGVDLGQVTWARSDDEHVASFVPPPNVEELGGEGSLEDQIRAGDPVAGVGLPAKGEGLVPVIADPFEAGLAACRDRGFYPINHLVVVRDDVLAAHPGLADQLFDAFAASRDLYLADLAAGRIAEPAPTDRVHAAVSAAGHAPLPYGIAPNRAVLETLMAQAVAQRIVDAPIPLEDLFAPELHDRAA